MNLHALFDHYDESEESMDLPQMPYRRMDSSTHHLQWSQTHRWPLSVPYQRGQNCGEEKKLTSGQKVVARFIPPSCVLHSLICEEVDGVCGSWTWVRIQEEAPRYNTYQLLV